MGLKKKAYKKVPPPSNDDSVKNEWERIREKLAKKGESEAGKSRTIPFAWNLIIARYIEQSIYGLDISTIGLLLIGKLREPIWGSREFLKFIFVVNFLMSVCVFVIAISLYYITTQETYL